MEHRNINQEQLAIDARIDPGDLSRFINGDHNIEFINIVKLAIGLKVNLIDLFDYDGAFSAYRSGLARFAFVAISDRILQTYNGLRV